MSLSNQQFYELLPAIYRLRDTENDEALKAYLTVFTEQIAVIQENVDQLYDDQFIETCAEWAVPYIGDLIGYKALHNISTSKISQRAEVANTIPYRRRKGTAVVLEQLARDVTGWPASVVEFFQVMATTQYMNHKRSFNHYAPDLRDWQTLEYVGTAFDRVAHTADVRHIDTDKGRHNINNIGIYLWRLQNYSLTKTPLVSIEPGHYYLSPLQHDLALFNKPVPEKQITHLARPNNVPAPINRRTMHDDKGLFYGREKSVAIYNAFNSVDEEYLLVPASDIQVCCLADRDGNWINDPEDGVIAIDPETGRIALGPDLIVDNTDMWADFYYGFSADIGGGEYQRGEKFDTELNTIETVASPQTIQSALDNLAGEGVVEITDTGRYAETPLINVNASTRIELRAANQHRPLILLSDELLITGGDDSSVTFDGLVIAGGRIRVPADDNGLRTLRLRHCTLVPGLNLDVLGNPTSPGEASIVIESANVQLEIENCILGGIRAAEGVEVDIHNTVIDANDSINVAYADVDDLSAGGSLKITNSTVIGKVHTRVMELASNCIFDAELALVEDESWLSPLLAERRQQGCVRFSYVPLNTRLPRRYRCQPELAINQAIKAKESSLKSELTSIQKVAIMQRLSTRIQPVFKSGQYDQPAYCQLALSVANEILHGADDEAEMGVFHDLFQPQREANLKLRLKEYLRFGLEAGIFYET